MNMNGESQKSKKLVIFDFDGVLVNTLNFSYKIHQDKNKDLTWESYQNFANGNFHDGFEKAVKDGKIIPTDNFYEIYEKDLNILNIVDILRLTINHLSDLYILVIISSTPSYLIKDYLNKQDLISKFIDILGSDINRSKSFKIKSILKKYNISNKDTVFITDTLGDIKEANECGVSSIGVTWGLHGKEILEKGKPIVIIHDPIKLFEAVQSVLK